jgi:hypothetical protein
VRGNVMAVWGRTSYENDSENVERVMGEEEGGTKGRPDFGSAIDGQVL